MVARDADMEGTSLDTNGGFPKRKYVPNPLPMFKGYVSCRDYLFTSLHQKSSSVRTLEIYRHIEWDPKEKKNDSVELNRYKSLFSIRDLIQYSGPPQMTIGSMRLNDKLACFPNGPWGTTVLLCTSSIHCEISL